MVASVHEKIDFEVGELLWKLVVVVPVNLNKTVWLICLLVNETFPCLCVG